MSFVYEDATKRWSPEAGGYVSKATGSLISKSPTYSDVAQKPSPTANPVTTSPLPTAVTAKEPIKSAPVATPAPVVKTTTVTAPVVAQPTQADHRAYIQKTFPGGLATYTQSQIERYAQAKAKNDVNLIAELEADAKRVGFDLPTQVDHQAYINQTFPGGVQAYAQGQAQRYVQALASGDTDLAARLRADAEKVGFDLPQQQTVKPPVQTRALTQVPALTQATAQPEDPRIKLVEAELNSLKEQQKAAQASQQQQSQQQQQQYSSQLQDVLTQLQQKTMTPATTVLPAIQEKITQPGEADDILSILRQRLTAPDQELVNRLNALEQRVSDPTRQDELLDLIQQRLTAPDQELVNRLNTLEQQAAAKTPSDDILEQLRQRLNQPAPVYDPKTDPAYQAVSKQLSDQVLEEMNRRGILNSTITAGQVTDVLASVLPQFQQQFYNLQQQQLQNLFGLQGAYSGREQQQFGNLLDLYGARAAQEQQQTGNLFGLQGAYGGREQEQVSNLQDLLGTRAGLEQQQTSNLFGLQGAYSGERQQQINNLLGLEDVYGQQRQQQLGDIRNLTGTYGSLEQQAYERNLTAQDRQMLLEQQEYARALEAQDRQIAEEKRKIENAWERVKNVGYVDNLASIALGVPVGTLSAEVQKTIDDRVVDLTKKQMDVEAELTKATLPYELGPTPYQQGQLDIESRKLDETGRYHDAQINDMIFKAELSGTKFEIDVYKQQIDDAFKRTEKFGEVRTQEDADILGVPVGTKTFEAKNAANVAKATADYRSNLLKIQEGNAKKLTPRQQAEQRILNGDGTPEDFRLIGITDDTPISKVRSEAIKLAQRDPTWGYSPNENTSLLDHQNNLTDQYTSLLTQSPAATSQSNPPRQISDMFAPSPVEKVLSGRAPSAPTAGPQIPDAGDDVQQMIDTARGNGYSDEQIRQALIEDGIDPGTYGL